MNVERIYRALSAAGGGDPQRGRSGDYCSRALVALLVTVVLPAALLAVTATTKRRPLYFVLIRRKAFVAPGMARHFLTGLSQLFHWYLYVIRAVPLQVPVLTVSVWLGLALPVIFGRTVLVGLVAPGVDVGGGVGVVGGGVVRAGVTTAVASDCDPSDHPSHVRFDHARIMNPTSSVVTT